jgi:hypothetical protein
MGCVKFRLWIFNGYHTGWPNPLAARSKVWVCGHSLAGIAGSNLMSVSCECVVRQRSLRPADYSSRGVLQRVVCVCV